jgi:hypothetical protein
MKRNLISPGVRNRAGRSAIAVACAALLVPGESMLFAQTTPAPAAAPAAAADADDPPLTADQLDSLVAPIALYPDDLLAQVLAASTYPLEVMQLQQWLTKNKDLKDKALADAVAKQPWDPAVQSMAAVPDAVKRLADDIQWTTDLGNAFLEQQKDVMDACQRMRKKAKDKGALTSNEQMKVETKVVETKEVIVVQSANPQVIYVPSYNPTYVYPPPVYPYPPVYYPPYTAGAAFFTFTAGVMIGAAFWGGSCCHCGWGGGNVNVNVNNNFNRNTNINSNINRGGGGNNNWNHNASHRGGTPYGNKGTASKYGGQTRAQQNSRTGGSPSASNRAAGASNRGGAGVSDRSAGGAGNRSGAAGASNRSAGGASPSASNRSSGGRGGDSIGSRDVGGGGSRGGSGGFGGGSGGFSGSSARSSSSRGASSMGSRGGGGGGGSRGGGGGGRRR